MLNQKARNDYLQLRIQGRSDRDIQAMFKEDPFIKIGAIARDVQMLDRASQQQDELTLKKAVHRFTEGKLYKEEAVIPNSREEWITFLEESEQTIKRPRSTSPKHDFEPLDDNESYMKKDFKEQHQDQEFLYLEEDLTGEYDIQFETAYIERELAKVSRVINPDKGAETEPLGRGGKINLGKVFGWRSESG